VDEIHAPRLAAALAAACRFTAHPLTPAAFPMAGFSRN
jgi:hypothetical protein